MREQVMNQVAKTIDLGRNPHHELTRQRLRARS